MNQKLKTAFSNTLETLSLSKITIQYQCLTLRHRHTTFCSSESLLFSLCAYTLSTLKVKAPDDPI